MRTLLLVLALVVAAAPAQAAPITFEWSGTVNPGAGFPLLAPANTPISFALTYDLDQSNTCAAGRGFFSIAGSMSLLGQTFTAPGGGIEVNDPLGSFCPTPIAGFVPGTLSSYTLRLSFAGALPLDYSQPGGFTFPLGQTVLIINAPFDGTLQALGSPQIAGVVVRGLNAAILLDGSAAYAVVPEPAPLLLMAIGIAALWRRAPRA